MIISTHVYCTFIKTLSVLLIIVCFCLTCRPQTPLNAPTVKTGSEKNILWIWDQPCDLRFMNNSEYEFTLLSKTIEFDEYNTKIIPRHSSVLLANRAIVFPVIRLESKGCSSRIASTVTDKLIDNICHEINNFPLARKIQIDYDAKASERKWYRDLLQAVRNRLPAHCVLSITALASWCYGNNWLDGLPVDEIVPMFFRMGRDSELIKRQIQTRIPCAVASRKYCLGVSLDEPLSISIKEGSFYVFNSKRWDRETLTITNKIFSYE